MKTTLIGPDSLEVDAVVPQCLDNQFVSDRVFSRMLKNRVDYEDPAVKSTREQEFRTEFIRSLIYSSQVVIQRAFFKNSEFLYRNYLPESRANLAAFATLIRERAIVPYLFKEESLLDQLEFNVQREGDRATRALLAEVGDTITCLRLAVDPTENAQLADNLATDFGSRLTRLEFLTPERRNALATELFADPGRLHEAGAWETFSRSLDRLVDHCLQRSRELRHTEGRPISRLDIYRANFAVDGKDENVLRGRFCPPNREDPFRFELKKYVDLAYNTNLPDQLGRYTFTPVGLPTRAALQDLKAANYRHDQLGSLIGNADALESARRLFLAHSQRAMALPPLRELSVADACQLRSLPEWARFKLAQERILRDPLRCLEHLGDFQECFDKFQRAFCEWYNQRYQRPLTEKRYASFVSLAIGIAGNLIVAGSDLGPIERTMLLTTSRLIPRKVRGYTAKLLVGVYDIGAKRLDAERTYSIELMKTNQELMHEDIVELLRSLRRPADDALPSASPKLADQGAAG